jgi:hypothetical protein
MVKIKIKDLPKDVTISQQEMRNVLGGEANPQPSPYPGAPFLIGTSSFTPLGLQPVYLSKLIIDVEG